MSHWKHVVRHLAIGSLLSITGVCLGGSPIIETIRPPGMQRGSEVTVTLVGTSLQDAKALLSQDERIRLIEVVKAEAKSATLKLAVDESVEPGLYPVWLVTESGVSNLRLISIGALPIIDEAEPNSEFAAAQKVTLNSTINGVVDREDVDYYQIELKAGQRLNVEIEGLRLIRTPNNRNILDPYIAILDQGEFEVASSDDASLWQQDGFCTFKAESDGVYTIMVRDSSFLGHPSNGYRLHVGDYPRPMAIYPAGGQPGQKLTAKLISADGTVRSTEVQLPAKAVDQHPVITKTDSGESPSPNFVRVADMPIVMESEPNNTFDNATPGSLPVAFNAITETDDDADFFVINMKKGQRARIDLYGRRVLRSKIDAVINVYGPDKKRLNGADDYKGSPDPYYQLVAAADGPHYIRVSDHLRLGSPLHHYRMEVTPAAPTVKLFAKELRRDEAWNTVIPRGGHGVMVVRAERMDFGGPVQLAVDGVPDHVQVTTYEMPAGRVEIPLVFSAKPDAGLGASLISIRGDSDKYQSLFRQQTKLVLGQNRRHLWSHTVDQAPMVVTEPMPFELEVVQPTAPIVRQGSKTIKVRIKRNEGFNNAVYMRTSYNPPGIGINNSRRFEKEATEIDIPITANGGAAIGKWPLVFVTRYFGAAGPVEVGAPPVMLEVQDRFFGFKFPNSTGELGSDSTIAVELEILRDLPGEAEVQLVGLPKGVTSPAAVQPIKPGQTSVNFPITIAADAKPGTHKTLNCVGRVKTDGGVIVQTVGTGQLRVDKPLPPKKKPAAKPAPKKTQPAKAPAKPLSRLEQLRQKSAQ